MKSFFIFIFFIFALNSNSFAEYCESCFPRERAACVSICEKAGEDRDECIQACLGIRCKGCDQKAGSSVSSAEQKGACEVCLRQMQENGCVPTCLDHEDPAKCRLQCAKQRCSAKCSLPAVGSEVPQAERLSRAKCAQCKISVEQGCIEKCGYNQERPGFVACKVGCVEKKCLPSCRPDLF
jgi:hypothetical protein